MLRNILFIFLSCVALLMGLHAENFPTDFPEILDNGGNGKGYYLEGFGGNTSLDQTGNQSAVTKNPVILLHGNGGNAKHSQWGMETIARFLRESGYNDSEIWAVSYLGPDNSSAELMAPHKNNIDDIRNFIDAVREYLNVKKVDIISHSLGGTMAKGYIVGLQNNGNWDYSQNRLNAVGTVVTMAAANYGLGSFSIGEFQTGSEFESALHRFEGTIDDTPYGSNSLEDQKGSYKKVTELDNDQIVYVAVWAIGDFVDGQNPETGRLKGAHLNQGYNLGSSFEGHERIIKDKKVFETVLPYLNSRPNAQPQPAPPVVSLSPNGGEFKGKANIRIQATNQPDVIYYAINDGIWLKYVAPLQIQEDTTVKAKAENKYGESPVVTAKFTKSSLPPFEKISGTATEHYLAGRIDNQKYITYGSKYGYIEAFYLYKIEGSKEWTDENPE